MDYLSGLSERKPRSRMISPTENRNDRGPHRSGQMHWAAIVTNEKLGSLNYRGAYSRAQGPT